MTLPLAVEAGPDASRLLDGEVRDLDQVGERLETPPPFHPGRRRRSPEEQDVYDRLLPGSLRPVGGHQGRPPPPSAILSMPSLPGGSFQRRCLMSHLVAKLVEGGRKHPIGGDNHSPPA